MNRRFATGLAALILAGFAVLAALLLAPRHRASRRPPLAPAPSPATPLPQVSRASSPTPPHAVLPSAPPAPSPKASAATSLAAELNSPSHPPAEDVEILHDLVQQYQRRLRRKPGHPIGDDIDLARVLTGQNPMKAVLLPKDHPALTADGHLRDRWGTPYFIHPRGYGSFEIRSAGPDRKLFTTDDLVASPGKSSDAEPLPEEPAPQ